MRIVQAVFGVFHHFELARELDRRGHLEKIYSTWPWARLKREGIAHHKVQTFPWIHTPEYFLGRSGWDVASLRDHLGYWNALAFDRWTARRIPACDAFIAISGAGLRTGRLVQKRGGIFICDRGSTHQRYQEEIVSAEHRRWGVAAPVSDIRDTLREEAIYAQADAITVPSSVAARSFVAMGIPAEKVHVIPYGVRLENFFPTAEPPADAFHVLFAGGVNLRKGFPYLLEAFARLRHPHKLLRVAGAISPEIRDILPRLPQDHVQFLGSVPQSDLRDLMSTSHVLVLPSIEEGFALVVNQAMACRCPVICSVNSGGEDGITDGIEGFLTPIGDLAVETIHARLQQLADDPHLQRTMAEAALRRVHSIGGWSAYGDKWEHLLHRLTANSLTR